MVWVMPGLPGVVPGSGATGLGPGGAAARCSTHSGRPDARSRPAACVLRARSRGSGRCRGVACRRGRQGACRCRAVFWLASGTGTVGLGRGGEQGEGAHGQHGVPVKGVPQAELVLVEAGLPFSLLEQDGLRGEVPHPGGCGPFPRSLPPNPAGIFRCTGLSSDLCRVRDGVRMDVVMAGGADDERLAPHSRPSVTTDGRRATAMRFGDSRVQALAGALCVTLCAVTGITNRSLRALMTGLLSAPYGMSQASYDLARLARNGLIIRRPHANTYDLTPDGLAFAIFYTKVHDRVLAPLFAAGQPQAPPQLRAALRTIEHHIDERLASSRLPAAA